jgi:hypothetical protein
MTWLHKCGVAIHGSEGLLTTATTIGMITIRVSCRPTTARKLPVICFSERVLLLLLIIGIHTVCLLSSSLQIACGRIFNYSRLSLSVLLAFDVPTCIFSDDLQLIDVAQSVLSIIIIYFHLLVVILPYKGRLLQLGYASLSILGRTRRCAELLGMTDTAA